MRFGAVPLLLLSLFLCASSLDQHETVPWDAFENTPPRPKHVAVSTTSDSLPASHHNRKPPPWAHSRGGGGWRHLKRSRREPGDAAAEASGASRFAAQRRVMGGQGQGQDATRTLQRLRMQEGVEADQLVRRAASDARAGAAAEETGRHSGGGQRYARTRPSGGGHREHRPLGSAHRFRSHRVRGGQRQGQGQGLGQGLGLGQRQGASARARKGPSVKSQGDKEACVACNFIWGVIAQRVDKKDALVDDVGALFEQQCQEAPDVFYEGVSVRQGWR